MDMLDILAEAGIINIPKSNPDTARANGIKATAELLKVSGLGTGENAETQWDGFDDDMKNTTFEAHAEGVREGYITLQ